MKQQLLLLEDVESLGKKGEVVSAKPGYVRNYLLPKRRAVVATPNMLRKQERLRAEREKQAVIDRKESEQFAAQIQGFSLQISVKVDPEGHMYGSVSAGDIVHLFVEKGIQIERRSIALTKPIKETGTHSITVKLKEGITASCNLLIRPEGVVSAGEDVVKPIPVEGTAESQPPVQE